MRRRLSSPYRVAAVFACGLFVLGQLAAQSSTPAPEVLTSQAVAALVNALGEDTFIESLKQSKAIINTSPEDLLLLKRLGMSDRVIMALLTRNLLTPPKPEAPKSKVPDKEGVYYKKGDGWAELLTETVDWTKSGMVNTVRAVASVGMLKPDYTGLIEQASSRSILNSPVELLIVSKTVRIHDFLVIPMKRTKVGRELECGPAKKGEVFKHAISYGVEKLSDSQFKVAFPAALAPGEYGVLERNQIVTENQIDAREKGRVFTFRLLM